MPLPPATQPFNLDAYETVTEPAQLAQWIAQATEQGFVAVDTETDGLEPGQRHLVGVSLALAPGKACYIPLGHGANKTDLGGSGVEAEADRHRRRHRDAEAAARKPRRPQDRPEHQVRHVAGPSARYDIRVAPIDDTMLISFVLEAGLHNHGMDELSELHLGHKPIAFKDVAGTGKSQVTFDQVNARPGDCATPPRTPTSPCACGSA